MELRLVDAGDVQSTVAEVLGFSPGTADGTAECLRFELSARLCSSRQALCNRVFETLAPIASVSVEFVESVRAELEARGDVTGGPGGIVAAAPLRAVGIGAGRFRIFGSFPSKLLVDAADPALKIRGVDRVLSFADHDACRRALSSLGGVVLTAERWAGLDRVPPAGEEWLELVGRRLEHEGEVAGARHEDISDEWRAYVPEQETEQRRRWKVGSYPAAMLWRARHQRGWLVFAWTAGGSPRDTRSLRLTGDEAARTMYSLDRRAALSTVIRGSVVGEDVQFECNVFLPRAEYRYVVALADRISERERHATYRCPAVTWPDLARTLASRLGISAVLPEGDRS